MRRLARSLALASSVASCVASCLACGAAVAAAQAPAPFDPATMDPVARDSAYPAGIVELALPSHGTRLNALMYVAQGAGPHPVVVLLHGFPGNERNLDIAQTLRRAGNDVLFFSYRGAWGSGGTFSFANAQEDVAAALRFVRSADATRLYRTDPRRVALVGHSMGGWLALLGAADDPAVACVGGIEWSDMAFNYGAREKDASSDSAQRAYATWLTAPGGPLRADGRTLLAPLGRHPEWVVARHAAALAGRPILLLDNDANVNHADLVSALRGAGATRLTEEVWPTDHSFSDRRIALSRAVARWVSGACGFRPTTAP